MREFDSNTEKILSELEKTQKKFWNLDRYCANFLYELIIMKEAKNVLEIGTSNGYSGIWILKALENTKGKLTTIEFWEKRQSVARANFASLGLDSLAEPKIGSALIVLQDLTEEIQNNKREKYDFVFIDANKSEYLSYFEIIDKILETGGVILADNILSHKDKVAPYVENLTSNANYSSDIVEIGTGMMLSVKYK